MEYATEAVAVIRPYRETDFDNLARIRRDLDLQNLLMGFPETAAPDDAAVKGWIERRLSDKDGMFFVIEDGQIAAGFIQIAGIHQKGRYGKFGIAIDPARRRRGLGLAALEQIAVAARERDLTKILAEVRADNIPSLALCMSAGYSIIGTMKKHYLGFDVLLMERLLAARSGC